MTKKNNESNQMFIWQIIKQLKRLKDLIEEGRLE